MGVKTMKKAMASVKKAKKVKKSSGLKPKAKKVARDRVSKIDEAIRAMATGIEASIAKAEAIMAASKAETDAKIAASDAKIATSIEETNKVLRMTMKDMSKNISGLGEDIGEIVELLVLPGLKEKMNSEFHYNFEDVYSRKKFSAVEGNQLAEIDLFLEGDAEVMMVEVKTRFKLGEMNTFLMRLETLREHDITVNLVGKTIYAGIAAITVDDNVRDVALKKGIYLVDIDQNNDKIKINPLQGAAGKW